QTLIKKVINGVYYDGNNNVITEAEYYAIELEYGKIFIKALSKYLTVETTYNGGTVKYSYNSDFTLATFEYVKGDVKLVKNGNYYYFYNKDYASNISFKSDIVSTPKALYVILDNVPNYDKMLKSITIRTTDIKFNDMGMLYKAYRIDYSYYNEVEGGGYVDNETVAIYLDQADYSYIMTRKTIYDLQYIYKGETLLYTQETGEATKVSVDGVWYKESRYFDENGKVIAVRLVDENDSNNVKIYEDELLTKLIKQKNGTKYYDGNKNEITEAEYNLIETPYGVILNNSLEI
ncbi:MAG: hypothetical protein MR357_05870, partial [Anaeroplasma sp.]|nr:hypothetical protein [Anaeroplasma sp.]